MTLGIIRHRQSHNEFDPRAVMAQRLKALAF